MVESRKFNANETRDNWNLSLMPARVHNTVYRGVTEFSDFHVPYLTCNATLITNTNNADRSLSRETCTHVRTHVGVKWNF